MLIENMENEKKEESIMKQKKKVKITGFIDTSIVRNGKKTVLTVEREDVYKRQELDRRLYVFPNSALKLNDKKINYLDFLSNTKDPNCIEALRYVQRHYDQKKVDKILNETPMSDIDVYKRQLMSCFSSSMVIFKRFIWCRICLLYTSRCV